MKKIKFSIWLIALLMFGFTAKAQDVITLGSGDGGSSDFPINAYWGYSYTQSIYSIDELLNAGAPASGGVISNIQYRVKKDASYYTNSNEWTIYMALTNKSEFSNSTDWVPLAELTEVFDGTMPASFDANDWVNFELTEEFEWDGTSNIVIAVKENKPGYNTSGDSFYAYNGTTQRGIYYSSDSNNPNPANPPTAEGRSDKIPLVKLFIEDIGSCQRPRMPHISEVTFTSAKINWTVPNALPANGYQVFLTTEDDEPAQDATPIATLGSDIEEYLFTDLTPNTQYYIWLRSNCGNDEFSNFSRTPVYTGYCIPQSTHENNNNYNKDFTTTGANVNIVDNFVPETPNNGYVDHYDTHKLEIVQGMPVDFSVQVMGENVNFAIWVDWNNDMEFDNVAEKIYSQSSYNTNPTFSGTINIGGTTTPGDYRMRIRAVGGSGSQHPCNDISWGEARDYKLTVVALEDCTVPPYMTTASNITHTSAILNWMAPLLGNNPPEYEVQWDTDMEFGNPSSATTSNLRADVSGLLSGENYFYRVRSVCDENIKSAWSDTEIFTTGGYTPINVTGFNQDVIAEGDTPASQSTTAKLDADNNVLVATGFYLGDDSRQRLPLNRVLHNGTHGTVTPEGVKYLLQNYTENNAINLPGGEGTLTLVEPQIYETLYLTGFAGNGAASLTIKVVYEDDSEQDFNKSLGDWWQGNQYVIKLNGRVNRNTNSYDPTIDNPRFYQITLDGIDQSKAVKEILIQNPGGSSSSKIANIFAVSGIVPALCPQPQNLAATEIGADNATVTWTGPNPDNGYMVYISQTSDDPTPSSTTETVAGSVTSYEFTELNPMTTYYVWVKSDCGAESSLWTGPITINTACVSTTIPYFLDFNEVSTPNLPECTSVETLSGNSWQTASNPGQGFSGNVLRYAYNGSNNANSWFYTNGLELEAGIAYKIEFKYAVYDNWYNENMKVAYGTAPTATAMTNLIVDLPNQTNENIITEEHFFTPDADGVYYFGFNCYSQSNQYYLYVDDISIDLAPTCLEPTNLDIEAITDNSAKVTWTASITNPADGYEIYYSQSAAAPTAETEAMASVETGNEYIINGLTYSTTYYVWVRANCGDNDLSIWAGPVSFTTDDVPTFMLTLNGANGTLSGSGSYAEGETVNISAIPNAGYNFVHWLYAGQVFSDEAQHSFQMPNSNMILTAVFEDENAEKFTLTLQANPEEAATLTGEGEYSQGTTISVKAEVTSEDDYEFLYWLKGDAVISQTAEFNFVMPGEAVTLVARYKIITSIENNDLDEVNVYPNPSNGIFNIVVNKDYLMEVVDLTGRTITTQNIIQGMNTLNIQNVNSGIYFIRLTSNNDTKTIRIVKN